MVLFLLDWLQVTAAVRTEEGVVTGLPGSSPEMDGDSCSKPEQASFR